MNLKIKTKSTECLCPIVSSFKLSKNLGTVSDKRWGLVGHLLLKEAYGIGARDDHVDAANAN